MTSYTTRDSDGNRVTVHLYSLDEYEADGGTYDDSGNGGETVARQGATLAERHPHPVFYCAECREAFEPGEVEVSSDGDGTFSADCRICGATMEADEHLEVCREAEWLCAATVDQQTDGSVDEVRDALMAVPGAWEDSVTGYILLPDWPEDAPLQARMVDSASTAGPR